MNVFFLEMEGISELDFLLFWGIVSFYMVEWFCGILMFYVFIFDFELVCSFFFVLFFVFVVILKLLLNF